MDIKISTIFTSMLIWWQYLEESFTSKTHEFDMSLKRQLIETTDTDPKMLYPTKKVNVEVQARLYKFYEPITVPLKTLIETTKK